MDEQEFLKLSAETLDELEDGLCDEEDAFDTDNAGGVLTIEFEDGTKYIINRQRAVQQIWAAAGARAWHFSYTDNKWIEPKEGLELFAVVAKVVKDKCGVDVEFK